MVDDTKSTVNAASKTDTETVEAKSPDTEQEAEISEKEEKEATKENVNAEEDDEKNEPETEEEKLEKAKKALFSKKAFSSKDKKEKKDKKDEQIAELSDRLMRQIAEFDNFRKRTEREKAQMFEIGAKDIIEKILPVADNLERGLSGLSEEERETPFAQGMDKVYKQLMSTLEAAGVKAIEAVGKEFDPNFHNAVMHEDNEEFGENIVSEEFIKGYTYRDSVVRHSMVKVAN